MDKTTLRTALSRRLNAINGDELDAASQEINERLIQFMDWSAIRRLHMYSTQKRWREVDLSGLISWLDLHHPHISIAKGRPEPDAMLPEGAFDVIIVPLLGFDERCQRLGRGRGWYDNFLNTQPQAVKIGIALEVQRLEVVPMEPHDRPLDVVVTETTLYRRQKSLS